MKIEKYEKNISKLDDTELIAYDLLLTRSFQKYINHLTTGKLNPRYLYKDWDFNIHLEQLIFYLNIFQIYFF